MTIKSVKENTNVNIIKKNYGYKEKIVSQQSYLEYTIEEYIYKRIFLRDYKEN
jgi:hypothetical protein